MAMYDKPLVPKWEKIYYPEEFLNVLFREWANFFTKRLQAENGTKYINMAMELSGVENRRSYHIRSNCLREIGKLKEAYIDAEIAYSRSPFNAILCLQLADTLYDMNQFEDTIVSLANDARKFKQFVFKYKYKARTIKDEIEITNENFKDNLGENFLPFAVKNEELFNKVARARLAEKDYEPKPLWKIRKEAKQCDVQTIIDEKEELVHPRIIEKRKLNRRIFRQVYIQKSWKDIQFLIELAKDKTLLLPQTSSTNKLRDTLNTNMFAVNQYMKMLHARSPFYSERDLQFDKNNIREFFKQNHLFRLQNKIRRDAFFLLDDVKSLRNKGKIRELEQIIFTRMYAFSLTRTKRLLPWKFQFINEVYNTLALAYFDQFILPPKTDVNDEERLNILLEIPGRDERSDEFVFGDKSTYHEPDAVDYNYINYRKYVVALQKWLIFAVYPVEKCFLYSELARKHIEKRKLKEHVMVTKKFLKEADLCKNKAWQLLAKLSVIKGKVYQKNWKDSAKFLQQAIKFSRKFKRPELQQFLLECLQCVRNLSKIR